jgi:hypothetical protein
MAEEPDSRADPRECLRLPTSCDSAGPLPNGSATTHELGLDGDESGRRAVANQLCLERTQRLASFEYVGQDIVQLNEVVVIPRPV